ncbi:MAG: hypothetical protein LC105_13100 [Chitinophagales bacterium]|nr:hypothetical protein [Chitinophagales bacterium]MCZ2394793.1 hypothetical protein [Chitinophagales bacterium]
MKELSQKWDQIVSKVYLLLDHNRKMKTELEQLKSQIVKLNLEKSELLKEKEELNKNINVLKLAKGVGLSDQERTEVKKQIKHYINEIDDCIAKMNA